MVESTWAAHKNWLIDEEIFPLEAIDQLEVSTDSVSQLIDDKEKNEFMVWLLVMFKVGKPHISQVSRSSGG